MLHRNNRETRDIRIGYIRLQNLARRRLQSNHEVEDGGEGHDRDKCYWYVDEGQSSGFDEWMIHGSLGMFHYDGTLIEERWDFGQGRDGRPKQGTKRRIRQTHTAGRVRIHIQENNTSAREILGSLILQLVENCSVNYSLSNKSAGQSQLMLSNLLNLTKKLT
jgi:hypothetical protein